MGFNILMLTRSTLFSDPGGDTIQVKNTASHLETLGHRVDIRLAADPSIDYTVYDLLHFFNIIRPNDIIAHAKRSGKPFVLSTIYVDYEEFERKSRRGLASWIWRLLNKFQVEYLKVIARALLNGEKIVSRDYIFWGHKKSMQWLIKNAACLLPNSQSEMNRLEKDLAVTNRFTVVPNAIDPGKFTPVTAGNARAGVLSVARIEGRKNQLMLIKALQSSPLPLTIIGKASPNHRKYLEACQAIAGEQVKFVAQLPQEVLKKYYSEAKVHVLPSWFETTGLSSLEAAYMGCNIVVTRKGDTEEYFGDDAFYCEPDNEATILEAVLAAHAAPYPAQLQKRIAEQYTWTETARITSEVYDRVLANTKTNNN